VVRDLLRPNLFVLACIFLCDVCSCHEILRAQRTRVAPHDGEAARRCYHEADPARAVCEWRTPTLGACGRR
jgi:hypothetical protein